MNAGCHDVHFDEVYRSVCVTGEMWCSQLNTVIFRCAYLMVKINHEMTMFIFPTGVQATLRWSRVLPWPISFHHLYIFLSEAQNTSQAFK